ncbi:phosphatidate cytidylyltransferase [bacterium]|nr:phosphatidate cytidylyltransferase [bacterium]
MGKTPARTRILIGVPLATVLVLLLWLDGRLAGGPIVHGIAAVALAMGVVEVYGMMARTGAQPLRVVGVGMVIVAVALDYLLRLCPAVQLDTAQDVCAGFYAGMGMVTAVILFVVLMGHLFFRDPERWAADAPSTLLGIFYVWFMGSHIFAIRALGGADAVGAWLVLAFLVAAKAGDSGAYFIGKRFGKHKLAPRVSPNKTIEGTVGGLVTSAGATVLVAWLTGLPGGLGYWALFGFVVGGVAQLGDLVESALKRSVGVKDSSCMLPTFGGMLDLIDSLLLAAPVAFWMLRAL